MGRGMVVTGLVVLAASTPAGAGTMDEDGQPLAAHKRLAQSRSRSSPAATPTFQERLSELLRCRPFSIDVEKFIYRSSGCG